MTHAEAVEFTRDLIASQPSNVAIICNHSGGKDSSRMLGYLVETFPGAKIYCVMADTGFEHVKPISAEAFARQNAARYDLDLHVVRNPNKTYLQMVERRGKFPSAGQRQCTSDLKRGPIQKFIRHLPEKVIINCTGIRAAESANRAKQNPWKLDEGMSKAGRYVYNWMPIFRLSLHDVLSWHHSNNVELHPVYVWAGGYLKRLSCRVCIFSTDADIHAIYKHDREAFDAIANLEQRIDFTMKNGKSLFNIIGQTPTALPYGGSEEETESPCSPF